MLRRYFDELFESFSDVRLEDREVWCKARTTPFDLSQGMSRAIDDAADHLGLSKDALLSRAEILRYSTTLAMNKLIERMRAAVLPEQSAEERMWSGIQAFLDAVEEHPEWWLLTRQAALLSEDELSHLAQEVHESISDTIAMLFTDTANLMGVGGAATTFEPLSRAFVGACAAVAEWWIAHPEVPKGTVAISLMNMLWMGFGDLVEANLWLPGAIAED